MQQVPSLLLGCFFSSRVHVSISSTIGAQVGDCLDALPEMQVVAKAAINTHNRWGLSSPTWLDGWPGNPVNSPVERKVVEIPSFTGFSMF